MTIDSYFTVHRNERGLTSVQQKWKDHQRETELRDYLGKVSQRIPEVRDIGLDSILFVADTSLYEARVPNSNHSLPQMEKSPEYDQRIIYTIEEGKLIKHRISKDSDHYSKREIKRNPIIGDIIEGLLLEGIPIFLGSSIPLGIYIEKGSVDYGQLFGGLLLWGVLRVGISLAPNNDEEMRADRVAWKQYKSFRKDNK